jgi:hypothetical protein
MLFSKNFAIMIFILHNLKKTRMLLYWVLLNNSKFNLNNFSISSDSVSQMPDARFATLCEKLKTSEMNNNRLQVCHGYGSVSHRSTVVSAG